MSGKKIVKTWTGYELCLDSKSGHFCQKEKGHVPLDHGKDHHICSADCDHVCNCGGPDVTNSKVWPEPIREKNKGGSTYIEIH